MYEFAKEKYFDEKALGNKSTRDKSLERVLQSPNIMVSASGVSMFTGFLSSNSNELRDRSILSLQEKQTRNISNITNEKTFARAIKLLKYKCISTKQHKFMIIICLN